MARSWPGRNSSNPSTSRAISRIRRVRTDGELPAGFSSVSPRGGDTGSGCPVLSRGKRHLGAVGGADVARPGRCSEPLARRGAVSPRKDLPWTARLAVRSPPLFRTRLSISRSGRGRGRRGAGGGRGCRCRRGGGGARGRGGFLGG